MDLYGFIVGLIGLISSLLMQSEAAKNVNDPKGLVTLNQTSTITVNVSPGEKSCAKGRAYLVSPNANYVSAQPVSSARKSNWDLLFANYASGPQTMHLGTYSRGISLNFGFVTSCNGRQFSMSSSRGDFTLQAKEPNYWRFGIEDGVDRDHDNNDITLEVRAHPVAPVIYDQITGVQVFSSNPNYAYPWAAGKNYQLMDDTHTGRAFDFSMPVGTDVLASEKGMVLWIEDNFGPGYCSLSILGQTNVVVIQTEEGINLNYLHLLAGSVGKAGLKVGDVVEKGQKIGQSGRSGTVCPLPGGTGAHLHIEFVTNCYNKEGADILRKKYPVGKPTLRWNCPAVDKSDARYSFK